MGLGRRVEGALIVLAVAVISWGGCQTHQRLAHPDDGAVLNDLRAVRSAEATYGASNLGLPDTLKCLSTPQECIPNYPAHAPVFLSATIAGLVPEGGYRRLFHPGPAATKDQCRPDLCSPSSLTSWAYTATPEKGGQGRRSFCVDSTDRICGFRDGAPPAVVGGFCPSPCDRIE
jgi:hypothetical protein